MNNIAFFEIQSSKPAREAEFYQEIFGWKFIKESGFPVVYYRIETGKMDGGLLQRPANTPPQEFGTNAFTCSVEVEDFDAVAKKILDKGGKVALPKFAVPGRCWQGYFMDADNNVFGIFEADEDAI